MLAPDPLLLYSLFAPPFPALEIVISCMCAAPITRCWVLLFLLILQSWDFLPHFSSLAIYSPCPCVYRNAFRRRIVSDGQWEQNICYGGWKVYVYMTTRAGFDRTQFAKLESDRRPLPGGIACLPASLVSPAALQTRAKYSHPPSLPFILTPNLVYFSVDCCVPESTQQFCRQLFRRLRRILAVNFFRQLYWEKPPAGPLFRAAGGGCT